MSIVNLSFIADFPYIFHFLSLPGRKRKKLKSVQEWKARLWHDDGVGTGKAERQREWPKEEFGGEYCSFKIIQSGEGRN